jgi:hypothetical protein
MRRKTGLGGAAFIVLSLLALDAAAQQNYSANLRRVPVDNRTQSMTTGQGDATAELDGSRLTVSGRFEGLQGPATIAELRLGAAVGARGPALETLVVDHAKQGSVSGTVRLSREALAALREGRLYIQIYSEAAPEGNLWGWLLNPGAR